MTEPLSGTLTFVRRPAVHTIQVARDDGCELHESCLACPFEMCVHDYLETFRVGQVERSLFSFKQRYRDPVIRALRALGVVALARRFRLSRRAVYHVLAGGTA